MGEIEIACLADLHPTACLQVRSAACTSLRWTTPTCGSRRVRAVVLCRRLGHHAWREVVHRGRTATGAPPPGCTPVRRPPNTACASTGEWGRPIVPGMHATDAILRVLFASFGVQCENH